MENNALKQFCAFFPDQICALLVLNIWEKRQQIRTVTIETDNKRKYLDQLEGLSLN